MVGYYYQAELCAEKKIVCYLQGQGHSEGLYNQHVTFSALPSKLLVHLQPDLVC